MLPTFYLFNLLNEACTGSCSSSWLVWLADFVFRVADGTTPVLCIHSPRRDSCNVACLSEWIRWSSWCNDYFINTGAASAWSPLLLCSLFHWTGMKMLWNRWGCSFFYYYSQELIKSAECPVWCIDDLSHWYTRLHSSSGRQVWDSEIEIWNKRTATAEGQ